MTSRTKKTPANDAAKSLKATEKRIRVIEKQIKKEGRLRNPGTGRWVKATSRNIVKIEREILRDVKQSKKTLKAASEFVDTIKGFFESKKKGAVKSSVGTSGQTKTKPVSKNKSKTTNVTRSPNKQTKKKQSQPRSSQSASGSSPVTGQRKSPTDNARQRIYEVSELPEAFRTSTANETLEAIEENATAYNDLLKPGDVFGGKVGYVNKHGHFVGGYTHQIFTKIEDYIRYMQEYKVMKSLGDDEEEQYKVLDLLKIIRFRAPKKVYSGKVPSFTANSIGWSNMTLDYNRKKAESKKAFKKKMQARDKALKKREHQRDVELARQRGEILKLKLENERFRSERGKK